MNTGVVSMRYAKALMLFATENHETQQVYKETTTLTQSYLNVPRLQASLLNPVLSDDKKAHLLLIAACGKEKPSVTLQRFVELVVKKGRTDIMLFIAHSYGTLYRKANHIIRGKLTLPSASQYKFAEKLQGLVEKKANGKVDFQVEENPDILGGFILEYDTYRLDASIKTQLSKIRRELH